MILIHSNETAESAWANGGKERLDATHAAVSRDLKQSGELVDANEIDVKGVTVIGHHNGEPVSNRGPFTEGSEWIGGYYIVDVADHARAVEIAGRFVENEFSPIEIRRIMHEPPTA
ncbi:YciI family protein [Microcella sp.]|uniref:YciI family protein n=1 Tax=Microcella sp. TaxID=1913979 RepID=UPI0026053525|nr:YciI family protein [Microcella sp.]